MEKIDQTIFYSIEKAIKSYRQFAQKRMITHGFSTTVDQGLVLKIIHENPEMTQQQIGLLTFKDHASITRIIENLVSKKILSRDFHSLDRRRFNLSITSIGLEILERMQPVVELNRVNALNGISERELAALKVTLNKIISNCQS
ncbi:MAG: hypothetical protein K2P84_00955 [Undibacterium sp.]|nr:hypothetical protein [Undibacterium sp.]